MSSSGKQNPKLTRGKNKRLNNIEKENVDSRKSSPTTSLLSKDRGNFLSSLYNSNNSQESVRDQPSLSKKSKPVRQISQFEFEEEEEEEGEDFQSSRDATSSPRPLSGTLSSRKRKKRKLNNIPNKILPDELETPPSDDPSDADSYSSDNVFSLPKPVTKSNTNAKTKAKGKVSAEEPVLAPPQSKSKPKPKPKLNQDSKPTKQKTSTTKQSATANTNTNTNTNTKPRTKTKTKNNSRPRQSSSSDKLRSPLKGNLFVDELSSSQLSGTGRKLSGAYRGKRLSSIGFAGEMHSDIPSSNYHKLLDQTVSEDDKLRQLLIWNLKAQLDKNVKDFKNSHYAKNSEESTIHEIGKTIKEELIQSLIDGTLSTGWRTVGQNSDSGEDAVLLPNPKNKANLENIKYYSKSLQNLEKQLIDWESAYKQSIAPIEKLIFRAKDRDDYMNRINGLSSQAVDGLNADFKVIEDNYNQTKTDLMQAQPLADKLYHTGYQMDKATELVSQVENGKIQKQIFRALHGVTSPLGLESKAVPVRRKHNVVKTANLLKAVCRTNYEQPKTMS
ncbi:hypothetical protein PVL30_001355 [Lodderomyces elongisporus]|uniref:uncharacterized protein n=1 Tax=Lodderomyces elongisporus TaxID=36914 RepID=UPI00291F3624|nr:uncharacterized protein PVL30_001355 [Lodderomyces elongisporus]WLF77638.1 hypothetical protein PVL30_001355 [Lodderomyces elongisporus]